MTHNVFTMVGRVGSDPTIKKVGEDTVVNFRLCATRRAFDVEANEWADRDHVWVTAEAWGQFAQHVYTSVERGMNIVAQGVLRTEEFRDESGPRTAVKFRVMHLGPDTKYYKVKVHTPAEKE
ncbi:MAG: single-stranded DNA-binding protein [Corynebacterium sp.]|nr:single-stranded DNA-binding protein [Corynebacterium sp.]